MDSKKAKKLVLNKETLRNLDARELNRVVGGMPPTTAECDVSESGNCSPSDTTCGSVCGC